MCEASRVTRYSLWAAGEVKEASRADLVHLEQIARPVANWRLRRRMVPAVRALWCQECLLLADDRAREWRLLRVDVPGEDDEPLRAAYCPECAE